jgi:cytochrome c-type biogenesis protein CcmH/NrfG
MKNTSFWTTRILIGSLALLWLVLPRQQTSLATTPLPAAETPIAQGMLQATKSDAAKGLKKTKQHVIKGIGKVANRVQQRLDNVRAGNGWKIVGIVALGILLTFLLLALMTLLAFGFGYSGNDFLAILVSVIGLASIIFLWIKLAKWIKNIRTNRY